jgi:Asp/Glu/hydantoin racemase
VSAAETTPAIPADAPIGVICLETSFTKILGHIRNPGTFDYPVIYEVVRGATPERVVTQADPSLIEPFCLAAQRLQARGAAAITTGCGFLVLFQKQLADAVTVPLFASSLTQLPMVHRMLAADRRVGLLVAKQASLTPRHLAAIGAEDVPVCITGVESSTEFREVMLEGRRVELDAERLQADVLHQVDQLARANPDLGALVIECTDLVPFAHAIQQRLGLPVFDIVTLMDMVHATLTRHPYH